MSARDPSKSPLRARSLRASAPIFALAVFGGLLALHRASAAPTRAPLELWGVNAGDVVEIDGAATPIKSSGPPRAFTGDPLPGNAPFTQEVAPGKHAITVTRQGCAPLSFTVETQGAYKRSVVISLGAHCGLPAPPPRAP
jgi:hypothetical protein